jgi:hypothetical protein
MDDQDSVVTEKDLYALDLTVNSGITHLELHVWIGPLGRSKKTVTHESGCWGLQGFRVSKLSEK